MGKAKIQMGVSWARSANGFIPHYRYKGQHIIGGERPWPQFLEGERMTVARYFLCLICESLFGEAPLVYDLGPNGQDMTNFRGNAAFNELPYMIEKPESAHKWVMNDGNPDVLGMFDLGKQFRDMAKAKQSEESES